MSDLREPLNADLLAELDPAKPVTMLNLMKFHDRSLDGHGSGWDAYLRYSAHTIDLFQYMTGERVVASNVMQGPKHEELGIAMDMSIQLQTESGILCTLALSFNNDGPLGTFFRYIGDTGTYIARYDDLVDGRDEPIDVSGVDVSMNGIELQDRDFLAAVQGGPEPRASIANVFPCYEVIADLERQLGEA